MTERLVHQRTKGPVSTPAQRVAELTSTLVNRDLLLAEANARVENLQRRLSRFETVDNMSFGGVQAQQVAADFILWEALLNGTKFRAIFELGTANGGFSWWLWAQTQVRGGMNFYTFDAIEPSTRVPCFERVDVFAQAEYLGKMMRLNEPCVVLCDNGNKPRELRTFSGELRHPESILVVHDWGVEVLPDDVPDNVEMLYGGYCDELHSLSRVFKLKEQA